MMDRKTCPKYVEFYSKNKLEKLVHLIGFIIGIYHDARSSESQISGQLSELGTNDRDVKKPTYVQLAVPILGHFAANCHTKSYQTVSFILLLVLYSKKAGLMHIRL
jgi:hypothetical protein